MRVSRITTLSPLRRQHENISTLRELVQEILHRSSEEMPRAIAEQSSQRNRPILEPLEVVKNLHGLIRSHLEDGSQVLVAAELCGAIEVSRFIGDQSPIRVRGFSLREPMDHGVGAIFGDFVDGSVFRDAAFYRRTEQVSGRIDQQSALWNCAVSTSSERVQNGEFEVACDLEDHAAASSLVFEGLGTGVISARLRDAVEISFRILRQRSDRVCSIRSTGKLMEEVHVARRIESKDAAATDLARLVIPKLSRSENDSVLAQEHASGRLFRRGRMQAALKGEQDGLLALRVELVQHAGASCPAIRQAVQVACCVDCQRASGKLSNAATIEIEEGRFFSGAVDLEDGSREGSCSIEVAVAVENNGSFRKRRLPLNVELMKCPESLSVGQRQHCRQQE